MKIISYNVNGIRAAYSKDLLGWIKAADPDLLCIQETKAQIDQIEVEGLQELGYHCFWYSAEKKRLFWSGDHKQNKTIAC